MLRGTSVPLACFLICQHPYQQHPQTRPDPRPRGWQDVSCNACIPEDLHRPLSERTKAGVSVLKSQGELPGPVTVASGGRTYPDLTRSGDSGNRADTWSKKYRRPGKRVCNHLVGRQQGSREAHHSPAEAGSRERQTWSGCSQGQGPHGTGGSLTGQNTSLISNLETIHINAPSITRARGRRQKDQEFFMEKGKKPRGAS